MTGRSAVGHRADGVDAPDVAAPGQAMRLIGKTTTMSKWAEAERWGPHPQGVLCKIEACTNVTLLEQSTDARASAKKTHDRSKASPGRVGSRTFWKVEPDLATLTRAIDEATSTRTHLQTHTGRCEG